MEKNEPQIYYDIQSQGKTYLMRKKISIKMQLKCYILCL